MTNLFIDCDIDFLLNMGKKRFKKRSKYGNDEKEKWPKKDSTKRGYELADKNNQDFEVFYKAQNIIDPQDWDSFMNILKQELPAAFRINKGSLGQASQLKHTLLAGLLNNQAIQPISWINDGLAFQTNLSRVEIRKSEELQKFHNFLISESENGYVTRQETVSMIPPLLLDVQPHHIVLDSCAAPGSKTAQIIEMFHSGSLAEGKKYILFERSSKKILLNFI